MKIGILIPDRSDRPEFLKNCLRMLKNQTIQPDEIKIINFPAYSAECDITERYRIGYDQFRMKGFDCILFIENDDFYSNRYIEMMVENWLNRGCPDLLGTDSTIYYHLGLKKYFTMHHTRRAAAMNTLIRADLDFHWCLDHDPYTDLHLWLKSGLQGIIFKPDNIYSIGIKHGIGLCGGKNHTCNLDRYIADDNRFDFLSKHMDQQSFQFYTDFHKKIIVS